MHLLFAVLMSVVIGASALPKIFITDKATFAQRKLSSFSFVSLPKHVVKTPILQEQPVDVAESVSGDSLSASSQSSSESQVQAVQSPKEQASSSSQVTENASSSEMLDRELATYTGPAGAMIIDEADLKACVCQGDKFMQCKLFIEGSCSEADEYVSVVARNPASNEFHKNLRCKTDNRFAGFVPVYGDKTLRMIVTFRDKIYKKDFSLTNHCGSFKETAPTEEE